MPTLSVVSWILISCLAALAAGAIIYYLIYWDKAVLPPTVCRTADMSAIERQTRQLQDRTPAAQQIKRVRAGAPASYDVDRTNDRRVADFAAFRANLKQVEVTAAQHALLDMGRGVRRPNPHAMGSTAFVPYQIAYARVWMEREHQNADAEVSHA